MINKQQSKDKNIVWLCSRIALYGLTLSVDVYIMLFIYTYIDV